MSFNISNRGVCIDSFKFLSSSLYSLVKNLSKVDFKYLSQVFYLKFDVLLPADVFEKFRNNRLKSYRLFTCHYVSVPALSTDAKRIFMATIELISDSDIDIICSLSFLDF